MRVWLVVGFAVIAMTAPAWAADPPPGSPPQAPQQESRQAPPQEPLKIPPQAASQVPPQATEQVPPPASEQVPPPASEQVPPRGPSPTPPHVPPSAKPQVPPPATPLTTTAQVSPPVGRLLALPYVGVHSGGLGRGFRVGLLLGPRLLSDMFSANGELAVDIAAAGAITYLSFSPLFHGYASTGELAIGPRIGIWRLTADGNDQERKSWMIGANAAVFFRKTGEITPGVLVSYAYLQPTWGGSGIGADVLAVMVTAQF